MLYIKALQKYKYIFKVQNNYVIFNIVSEKDYLSLISGLIPFIFVFLLSALYVFIKTIKPLL